MKGEGALGLPLQSSWAGVQAQQRAAPLLEAGHPDLPHVQNILVLQRKTLFYCKTVELAKLKLSWVPREHPAPLCADAQHLMWKSTFIHLFVVQLASV